MLSSLPLTLAPLIVYNLVTVGLIGPTPGDPWVQPLFTVAMISDGRFTPLTGDLLIVAALVCLFVEILAEIRSGGARPLDHALSVVVLILHLGEFLTVAAAATSVFFVLTVIAGLDVVAGLAIGRRGGGPHIERDG